MREKRSQTVHKVIRRQIKLQGKHLRESGPGLFQQSGYILRLAYISHRIAFQSDRAPHKPKRIPLGRNICITGKHPPAKIKQVGVVTYNQAVDTRLMEHCLHLPVAQRNLIRGE